MNTRLLVFVFVRLKDLVYEVSRKKTDTNNNSSSSIGSNNNSISRKCVRKRKKTPLGISKKNFDGNWEKKNDTVLQLQTQTRIRDGVEKLTRKAHKSND